MRGLTTIMENYASDDSPPTPLKAVVLDNDETTGSYGIVFSILTHLRNNHIIQGPLLKTIYARLASQMHIYGLFRPYLVDFIRTLSFLRDEGSLESVIMYTNQTEESPYIPSDKLKRLIYNVPYTISYLMYSAYGLNIFQDILSRPSFFRGLHHTSCPKSFSRIFALDNERPRDTRDILFVDDNASRSFITATSDTEVHDDSFYRITPYYRILTDEELDEFLEKVFQDINIPAETLEKIKRQYRYFSPLADIEKNNIGDEEFLKLKKIVVEKYL